MDPVTPVLHKALRYLSFRSRSEKELREYLLGKTKPVKRGVVVPSKEIVEEVIQKLKTMRFLNDLEFAKSFVRSRTEYKPQALGIVKMELRQRGISQEMIEEALLERGEGKDDKTMARELLEKHKKKYIGMEMQERYRKAGGFLARKGFSFDAIKAAIDSVFGNSI